MADSRSVAVIHRSGEGQGGPPGSPLGIYGDRNTIPGQRASRRTERWSLKELQRAWTEALTSSRCGYPIGPVTVEITTAFIAHVLGISHCGSPWVCPICAPVIRERRAQEFNAISQEAERLGWSQLFGVGTVRHHMGQPLGDMLPVVTSGCSDTLQGRWWQTFKARFDYVGMIRTIEVNYGPNGWHPHWQSLMFFRRLVPESAVAEFSAWWLSRWDALCTRSGYGPLVDEGLVVEALRSEDAIGDYLVKPAGSWGVGRELTRGDVKRESVTFPAFDLLAPGSKSLWLEYEAATRGRRFSRCDARLRAELVGSEPEQSDEELATAEGSGEVLFRISVGGDAWSFYVQAGLVGWFLEQVEWSAALVSWLLSVWGHVMPDVLVESAERKELENA